MSNLDSGAMPSHAFHAEETMLVNLLQDWAEHSTVRARMNSDVFSNSIFGLALLALSWHCLGNKLLLCVGFLGSSLRSTIAHSSSLSLSVVADVNVNKCTIHYQ